MANTILLKGDATRKERLAGGTISPGDLLTLNSSDQYVRHNTAAGVAAPVFAFENDLVGKGISDDYASGDTVQAIYAKRGDEVLALLASGQNVSVGDFLESAGNGTLRAITSSGANVVARALESKNNTSGDTTGPHDGATRIKVEVF